MCYGQYIDQRQINSVVFRHSFSPTISTFKSEKNVYWMGYDIGIGEWINFNYYGNGNGVRPWSLVLFGAVCDLWPLSKAFRHCICWKMSTSLKNFELILFEAWSTTTKCSVLECEVGLLNFIDTFENTVEILAWVALHLQLHQLKLHGLDTKSSPENGWQLHG